MKLIENFEFSVSDRVMVVCVLSAEISIKILSTNTYQARSVLAVSVNFTQERLPSPSATTPRVGLTSSAWLSDASATTRSTASIYLKKRLLLLGMILLKDD